MFSVPDNNGDFIFVLIIFITNSSILLFLPSQICDGRVDCLDGGGGADECGEMCARRKCEVGVRCETGDVCIRVPHRHVCNGENNTSRN